MTILHALSDLTAYVFVWYLWMTGPGVPNFGMSDQETLLG
jgi:hypothetical protein